MKVINRRWIPWSLVGLRLGLAPTAFLLAWAALPRWLWLLQFVLAAVSDIYDGKLARRWGTGASYHAKSARLFGLSLIPATIAIMGFGQAGPLLWLALAIGVLSELEGVVISLVLPRWTHDVPHLGAALAIRREAASALTGLVTYELVYWANPVQPRATTSWTISFLINVARQHSFHRVLTFTHPTPYWSSLGRAYVMYTGALIAGTGLNWLLTGKLDVDHQIAWACCLLCTATISLLLLKRFVFAASRAASGISATSRTS